MTEYGRKPYIGKTSYTDMMKRKTNFAKTFQHSDGIKPYKDKDGVNQNYQASEHFWQGYQVPYPYMPDYRDDPTQWGVAPGKKYNMSIFDSMSFDDGFASLYAETINDSFSMNDTVADATDFYFYVLSGGGYVKAAEDLTPNVYQVSVTANTSYAAQTLLFTTITETGNWWSAGGSFKQVVYKQELRIGGIAGTLLDTATYTERWEWSNTTPTTNHTCTVTMSGSRFANSYLLSNAGTSGTYKDASNYLVWASKVDITASFTLDDTKPRDTTIGSFTWHWAYKIYDNTGNTDVDTCDMSGDINQYGNFDGGLPFMYYYYDSDVPDATDMMPKAATLTQASSSYRSLAYAFQQELYKVLTYQKATYTWDCSDVTPQIATTTGDTAYIYANANGTVKTTTFTGMGDSTTFDLGLTPQRIARYLIRGK